LSRGGGDKKKSDKGKEICSAKAAGVRGGDVRFEKRKRAKRASPQSSTGGSKEGVRKVRKKKRGLKGVDRKSDPPNTRDGRKKSQRLRP